MCIHLHFDQSLILFAGSGAQSSVISEIHRFRALWHTDDEFWGRHPAHQFAARPSVGRSCASELVRWVNVLLVPPLVSFLLVPPPGFHLTSPLVSFLLVPPTEIPLTPPLTNIHLPPPLTSQHNRSLLYQRRRPPQNQPTTITPNLPELNAKTNNVHTPPF